MWVLSRSCEEVMDVSRSELDVSALENWLWEAACKIRGDVDAPKYKDYILPIIFIKRLSDVFEDEVHQLADQFGGEELAEEFAADDHSLVRFYLPAEARWENIARQTTGIGEYLTDVVRAIARENPRLQGVVDIVDFNATTAGQRIISDGKLKELVDVLGRNRLATSTTSGCSMNAQKALSVWLCICSNVFRRSTR